LKVSELLLNVLPLFFHLRFIVLGINKSRTYKDKNEKKK
jgi:hypothetical protein